MLVDITKDVFQGQGHYQPVTAVHLPGYKVFTEGHTGQIRRAAQLIHEAERPLVYGGGGLVGGERLHEAAQTDVARIAQRHEEFCFWKNADEKRD